jgi:hypothetical protein
MRGRECKEFGIYTNGEVNSFDVQGRARKKKEARIMSVALLKTSRKAETFPPVLGMK